MCERCDDTLDRRGFLHRALVAGGAVAGGALAGGILLPGVAEAAVPPVETVGLGEDRLPAARPQQASRPGPGARKPKPKGLTPPRIVTRSQWGANESIRTSERAYAPIRKLIVHHTASPTNPRDPVAWVRKTYEYHVLGRGYSDMGYNFMIDHRGVIYEGRWARPYGANERHEGESAENLGVIGGHALGVNTGTCGICLIGDFTTGRPTTAAIYALITLLAWKSAEHRIDPLGSDRYVSLMGEAKVFHNISGHRNVGNTICPGPYVFRQFPAIRQSVRQLVGRFPAQTVDLTSAIRYNYTRRPTAKPATPAPAGPAVVGYRILSSDGRVSHLGKAGKSASPRDEGVTQVLAIGAAPGRNAYYSLDTRGGVLAFAGAPWHGSPRAKKNKQRPVDLAVRRGGDGYWVLAANGGVFPFGKAQWFGSLSKLIAPDPRKLRATPSGNGYWLLAGSGRVYAFGDAVKAGSPRDRGRRDVVDLAPTPSGRGYWVLLSTGTVLAFGDAPHLGDLTGKKRKPAAITGAPGGYYLLTAEGAVTPFGKVPNFGGIAGRGRRAVALATVIA